MGARILIADDSPAVQASLKQLLESHFTDWKVCGVAENGRQAVEQAMDTHPDLIILDLKMPLMDGLRAAVMITKYLPKVPILLYTLYQSLELDANAKKAGVYQVISKSDPDSLLKVATELLGGQRMTAFGGPA